MSRSLWVGGGQAGPSALDTAGTMLDGMLALVLRHAISSSGLRSVSALASISLAQCADPTNEIRRLGSIEPQRHIAGDRVKIMAPAVEVD